MAQQKGIVGKLDKVTRQIVKLRDDYTCQRCLNRPSPQGCHCAHIYGRNAHRLRWDLLNNICLCYGCHQWGHSNPTAFKDWFREKYPHRMAHIEPIFYQAPRPDWPDKEALLEQHKQKLKELSTDAGGVALQDAVQADAH
jgi:hypothetical protein